MNLSKFFQFNDTCPVCQNKLHTYMNVREVGLWKADHLSLNEYRFTLDKLNSENVPVKYQDQMPELEQHPLSNFMTLHDRGDTCSLRFSTPKLTELFRQAEFYFFKVCNPAAIKWEGGKFNFVWYNSCYYRSSPMHQFRYLQDAKPKWQLGTTDPDHSQLVNRFEHFVIKSFDDPKMEKVYLLSMGYEQQQTKFYHYSLTAEQQKDEFFEPRYFEKEDLPLLDPRPDFSLAAREQLLNKFNVWINFS